ncbi:MAG: hypothetical protein IJ525_05440 [Alphaproteobacteria bacterium]|nr:hypothetical protein [Alphaproteobacteria bacterium]MBR3502303.1 hypothetical protein [Alphaproteobacteria bacterium]
MKYAYKLKEYKIKEPEPIVLRGFDRVNGKIVPKIMFFVKYSFNKGYLYLEDGERMRLTPLSMKVVEQLIDALQNDVPYMSGQRLLEDAGSTQFYIGGLFSHASNWRKFITMRVIGYYSLNLYAESTYEDYIRPYLSSLEESPPEDKGYGW